MPGRNNHGAVWYRYRTTVRVFYFKNTGEASNVRSGHACVKPLNPFPTAEILCARSRDRPSPRRPRRAPPGPLGPTLWFPGTAGERSPGPSAETFTETALFVVCRPPGGDGRQALLCALSAGEPCRQFVGSFSRTDRAFLSYNKVSLESLLEWLRSLNGSAGLRVWKDAVSCAVGAA